MYVPFMENLGKVEDGVLYLIIEAYACMYRCMCVYCTVVQ